MTAINTTDSRAWLGIVVALAAGAAYAVANTSANIAYQAGSDAMTVAATRFLVPVIALFVWMRPAACHSSCRSAIPSLRFCSVLSPRSIPGRCCASSTRFRSRLRC